MENKLWLISYGANNIIETRQIDILETHTIKYKVKAEFPFENYNYIHMANLNTVQSRKKEKLHYIVSLSKDEGIITLQNYIYKQLNYLEKAIVKYENLNKNLGKLINIKGDK